MVALDARPPLPPRHALGLSCDPGDAGGSWTFLWGSGCTVWWAWTGCQAAGLQWAVQSATSPSSAFLTGPWSTRDACGVWPKLWAAVGGTLHSAKGHLEVF